MGHCIHYLWLGISLHIISLGHSRITKKKMLTLHIIYHNKICTYCRQTEKNGQTKKKLNTYSRLLPCWMPQQQWAYQWQGSSLSTSLTMCYSSIKNTGCFISLNMHHNTTETGKVMGNTHQCTITSTICGCHRDKVQNSDLNHVWL